MLRFEHPEYLWLLLAAPAALILAWMWQRNRRQKLARFGDSKGLVPPINMRLYWFRQALLAVAFALIALAWAGPVTNAREQAVAQKSADVFLVLDISNSMLCQDVLPNRLELAKAFSAKLVDALAGERIGLILFAGNAIRQAPLSTDYHYLHQCLRDVSTELMTQQGTNIPLAIDLAQKSFDDAPGGGRAVIVISDVENNDQYEELDAPSSARHLYEDFGIVTYSVGVGTANGGPVPTSATVGGQYKRDETGNVVRSRMDEKALKQLASAGGGQALMVSQGDRAIETLRREINQLDKRDIQVRSQIVFDQWYAWVLLPAVLLLLIERWLAGRKRGASYRSN
ncbi:MAG: VWA domain-containing protein [Saprospiraceae bacterium]|nr:VWA domain-containing protein [Saprospiraceae bacterium]